MGLLRRLRSQREPLCSHIGDVAFIQPGTDVCQDCVEGGTEWVHLRMCLVCGKTGCCNSSPMKHSVRHHEETGHLLMRSIEPREDWGWCFEDEVYLKPREYRRKG